jgi:hypothetical protein
MEFCDPPDSHKASGDPIYIEPVTVFQRRVTAGLFYDPAKARLWIADFCEQGDHSLATK